MKKLLFLLGMTLSQYFVWGYGELRTLGRVFSSWQGQPGGWGMAYERTCAFAEKNAENAKYNCKGDDLLAIWAFVANFHCVKLFSQTEEFGGKTEKYDAWLKNLCRIAYNVACQKNPGICSTLKGLSDQLSSNSIKDLCENEEFKGCIGTLESVLNNAIDWDVEE